MTPALKLGLARLLALAVRRQEPPSLPDTFLNVPGSFSRRLGSSQLLVRAGNLSAELSDARRSAGGSAKQLGTRQS